MPDIGLAIQEWFSYNSYQVLMKLLQETLKPNREDVLLDIGGGTGRFADRFSSICKEVWILDPEARKLEFGRKRRKGVNFMQGSAYPLPFADRCFSKATAMVSFHHFPDQDAALQDIKRVLKPDGRIVLLEFDPTTIRGKVVNLFENKLGKKNCRFYTPTEMKRKLGMLGYGEISILKAPIGYLLTAVNNSRT